MTPRFSALAAAALVPSVAAADPGIVGERPDGGRFVEFDGGYMVEYDERVPGTDVVFRMVPVPGGETLIGSPADEEGRGDDEGPQFRARVAPMWVAQHEVTWAEYHVYMRLYEPMKRVADLRYRLASAGDESAIAAAVARRPALDAYLETPDGVDAVTCPTPLYDATFTYEPGDDPRQPAVTMTQFAAKQYTKWLSRLTDRDYRLPTAAEWEYAARAGSDGAYSFGDDPERLGEHAWFFDNSDDRTQIVGLKKPNAFGLHDVHGNVAELVLDEYDAGHYAAVGDGTVDGWAALRPATKPFPREVRGGSWQDDPPALRSAARRPALDDEWTLSDPNLPVSPWWYTEYESQAVGMRIVRPLAPMDAAARAVAWEADTDDLRLDIEDRIAEGRGVLAPVTRRLPAALRDLNQAADELDSAGE